MPTQNDSTIMAMGAPIDPAAVLSPAMSLEPATSDGAKIRVGIVGFGRVGAGVPIVSFAIPKWNSGPSATLTFNTSANGPASTSRPITTLWSATISMPSSSVLITTPRLTSSWLRLEAGKHVFCEKPPGRCVADVERIQAAERASGGRKLKFGFNHRYHGSIMEAKQIVDSGRFGRVLWLRGVYGKCGGIQFENEWRNDRNIAGGGILLDQGIHMLDLCRFFCGDFDQVKSLVTTSFWKIPFEDNAFAILSNVSGQVAMVHSSATQWKHEFSLEICMEDGYVHLQGILSSTRSYGDERLTFARKQLEDTTRAFGRPREETIIFDTDDSWTLEVADFAEAILQDRPIASGNSHDALRVMELIETVYGNGVSR